jgi:hypothetical protein
MYIENILIYVGENTMGYSLSIFQNNGTWVCPPGVNNIILQGCGGAGGGGGGSGGSSSAAGQGGGGGGAAEWITAPVQVTPGTTYTITIGNGGVGGTAGIPNGGLGINGIGGGTTSFVNGATSVHFFGGAGGNGGSIYSGWTKAGSVSSGNTSKRTVEENGFIQYGSGGLGGSNGLNPCAATSGSGSMVSNDPGTYSPAGSAGLNSGSYYGGGAGGGGGRGNCPSSVGGGNGGNGGAGSPGYGNPGTVGSVGTCGIGGGGGGGGGQAALPSTNGGGIGGAGGNGILYIHYWT